MIAEHNGDAQIHIYTVLIKEWGAKRRAEGVETGYRIEGSLFSPGSRNYSYSVKNSLGEGCV